MDANTCSSLSRGLGTKLSKKSFDPLLAHSRPIVVRAGWAGRALACGDQECNIARKTQPMRVVVVVVVVVGGGQGLQVDGVLSDLEFEPCGNSKGSGSILKKKCNCGPLLTPFDPQTQTA